MVMKRNKPDYDMFARRLGARPGRMAATGNAPVRPRHPSHRNIRQSAAVIQRAASAREGAGPSLRTYFPEENILSANAAKPAKRRQTTLCRRMLCRQTGASRSKRPKRWPAIAALWCACPYAFSGASLGRASSKLLASSEAAGPSQSNNPAEAGLASSQNVAVEPAPIGLS